MENVLEEDLRIVSEDALIKECVGKTVLVTGATGLIGSLMIKSFLYYNQNHHDKVRVLGVVRSNEKAEKIFGRLMRDSYFCCIQGDLRYPIQVTGDVDYIVHAASVTASQLFVTKPVETLEVTYQGTKNILELAREKKSKGVVFLSSMEVYGIPSGELEKVTEIDLGYIDVLNVRSSYSEGKRIAECMCAAYADQYKVPVKIARLAQTFGAGVLQEDNRVYAQFARSVVKGQDIVLHTEGKSNGNYCYTTDVIRALLLLLQRGENGEAYNVCNEITTTTIADMATMVAEEFGRGKTKVVFDVPKNAKKYGYAPDVKMHLDATKLRKLGWEPRYDLKNMYKRMISGMETKCILY